MPTDLPSETPIRIGVSSCLLGNAVRFDGGHKRDSFLTDQLQPFVEYVPVCPEVEVGMAIPRPTLRLQDSGDGPRLIAPASGEDYTAAMRAWADRRLRALEGLELSGYVLKKNSPSCGMERVRIYGSAGMPTRNGQGVFASVLRERFPDLPIEEEGRLNDPVLRESFIERVFAYRRVRDLFARRWRAGDLVAFHTAHKLQLMAHSPSAYRALGRFVADVKSLRRNEVEVQYQAGFMAALAQRATARRHLNVLQHILGYFRTSLDEGDRAELLRVMEEYGARLVPLVVPITLIQHHLRRCGIKYLADQTYLAPHPKELMLRNHV